MRILVQRRDSLGDVVDTTPVCARLRKENPDAEIWFETNYKQVYLDNPDGVKLYDGAPPALFDKIIDLNMSHERRMSRVGIVESYMEDAFGDRGGSQELRLAIGGRPPLEVDWSRVITIHAARSWPQRTLPHEFWIALCDSLVRRGWTVVGTGTQQDWPLIPSKNVIDTRGWYDLKTQLGLLQNSRCFIASQSGPQSFAQATDVAVVALMTMGLPWIVERDRKGIRGYRFRSVQAPISCVGCQHRIKQPSTFFNCERGDNACVRLFDPEDIADIAEWEATLPAEGD